MIFSVDKRTIQSWNSITSELTEKPQLSIWPSWHGFKIVWILVWKCTVGLCKISKISQRKIQLFSKADCICSWNCSQDFVPYKSVAVIINYDYNHQTCQSSALNILMPKLWEVLFAWYIHACEKLQPYKVWTWTDEKNKTQLSVWNFQHYCDLGVRPRLQKLVWMAKAKWQLSPKVKNKSLTVAEKTAV